MKDKGFGIYQGWSHNGQIVVYRVTSAPERKSVDSLMNAISEIVTTWPVDTPLLNLVVYSSSEPTLTPYARSRLTDIYDTIPENLNIFTASVITDVMTLETASAYLRSQSWRNPKIVERVFSSEAEALAWLETLIEPE